MSNPEIVVYTPSPDSLADLAAAAPELLAALQEIADGCNSSLTCEELRGLALVVCRAAIAKATNS